MGGGPGGGRGTGRRATALVPLLFLGSFERLLGYVMFTDALSLAAVASCLFMLRRRGGGDGSEGAWRMPGYPWLPAAFVLVPLGVAGDVLARQTRLARRDRRHRGGSPAGDVSGALFLDRVRRAAVG